jgi:CRP-like cAMP-binding protein
MSTAHTGINTRRPSASQVLIDLKSRESLILSLFKNEELEVISRTSAVHVLKSKDVFMRQGDNSSSMYCILSGNALISVDTSGKNDIAKAVQVDTVSTVVGEVGMLTGQRREAFGQAGPEGCVLLELTISELKSLSLKRLQLRAKLISLMAKAKKEKLLNLVELSTKNPFKPENPLNPYNIAKKKDTLANHVEIRQPEVRKSVAKIVSIAEGVRTTIRTLEIQEEAAIQAVLSKADSWINDNLCVEEEYEVRPLISFLDQYPLSKRMFIAGAGVALLHKAAWTGHLLICSQLLQCGCPLDLIDKQHKNVLHHVVDGSNILRRNHFETMRMFLARGAMLIRDCDGNSPADISKRDDMSLLLNLHLRETQLAKCQMPHCARKPLVLCSNCRLAKYCCMEHLRADLQQHLQVCARACPASNRGLLSRRAAESIAVAHLRVNNTSLEPDWQVKKARGLSMEAFVSLQKLRVYFSLWDRYRWIVRAHLSVLYARTMALPVQPLPAQPRHENDSECDAGLPGSGGVAIEPGAADDADDVRRGDDFVVAVPDGRLSVRIAADSEADFARMGKMELRRLCLPDYRAVRCIAAASPSADVRAMSESSRFGPR